jgi:excinuclease ABC subunit C
MMELNCALDFSPAHSEEFFRALPASLAVFCVEPRAELTNAQPYVLRTADLRRRLERLLGAPDPATKRLNLRDFAGRVRWRVTGSKFEQALVLWQHMRALYPQKYRARMRLRPAALLKVNLRNEYPRCYVTRRILAGRRSADAFAERFLDLFKARRCQIKIRRDPSFPGCIYSEMKMCLAPCFAGCSKEEYDVEVGRVVSFLATGGASLAGELEREREAASEATDFERAAAVHRKIEKVSEVLRGLPEPARRIEELHAVILERAAEVNAIAVFAVRGGIIAEPFLLRFDEIASQPRSLDAMLKEHLEPRMHTDEQGLKEKEGGAVIPSEARNLDASGAISSQERFLTPGKDAGVRNDKPGMIAVDRATREDHLALLARWYYAKPRSGEIFFPASTDPTQLAWPYRRIIRACSRLLAGLKEEEDTSR